MSADMDWTDDEREERYMEVAAEEDPEPTVEDDLDLAVALLHNRPDPHGDLRDDGYARLAMAWTDQFDLLMGRYKARKRSAKPPAEEAVTEPTIFDLLNTVDLLKSQRDELREQVAALTAEVERQKERGDLLRAEVHASWRERDEAVALLREARMAIVDRKVYSTIGAFTGRLDAFLAAPSVPVSAGRDAVAAVTRLCEEGLREHQPHQEGIPYCRCGKRKPCPDHARYSAIRAALPALPPKEERRVIVCGDATDLYADWEPCDDETLALHDAALPPQEEQP